jgi:iron complex transport system permease protein
LALGDDVAVGLGQRLRATRAIGTLAVLALAGGAVAVAGNVAFVGLVAPHLARYFVGVDYRKVVPIAGLLGALLVVVADGVGRLIRPPFETPVGLLTAVIGVPFLLYYARRVGHSA